MNKPAFPFVSAVKGVRVNQYGMTMRQYYKAAALTGLMSDGGMRPSCEEEFDHMAERLGQMADAMIAEDEKNA